MNDLIVGRVASDESDPWSVLMESLGRAMITVQCPEMQLPYVDAHGRAVEWDVPKGSTITLHYNYDGRYTYQELRAETSRHVLLSITTGSHRMTLFNDGTLQGRNPTPQDVRQRSLAGAAV